MENKSNNWINYEHLKFEQDFMKKKQAEVFPIMSKSDEQIDKEVREGFKDSPNGMYDFSSDTRTLITGKEGAIAIEIALRKEVRDLLNK